jgi:hypothetical protein
VIQTIELLSVGNDLPATIAAGAAHLADPSSIALIGQNGFRCRLQRLGAFDLGKSFGETAAA